MVSAALLLPFGGLPALADEPLQIEFEDSENDGNAERTFAYAFPAELSVIPGLADTIRAQEEEALSAQKKEWGEAVEEFGELGCITCVARAYSATWMIAADTPRFLVLQSEKFTYTGGAHGNSFFNALAWDRLGGENSDGEALRPVDMFVSETALENTAFGDYCQALLEAKGERLGMNVTDMNPFEGCPSVTELVVIPLSSDGTRFDRMQFLAAPYVAGSFAEGPYTFEVPITSAILAAVKPEYLSHFVVPSAATD